MDKPKVKTVTVVDFISVQSYLLENKFVTDDQVTAVNSWLGEKGLRNDSYFKADYINDVYAYTDDKDICAFCDVYNKDYKSDLLWISW